jgi:putative transposase
VPRSTYYHRPRLESAENLHLLRRLDELYMDCPFFGSRRMAVTLEVNRKRIQRLMRILGIEALYPKPNLTARLPVTRSTRTYCAASPSNGPTKSGAPILRTFRCMAASSTWWP